MSRSFISLFGLEPEQDVRRTAIAAVRNGYAVVPVVPGGKVPVCTLNTRELRELGRDHPCGVLHAITDDKSADKVFARLAKTGDRYNIGVVAGPSRLVVVDADTKAAVEAFCADWAEAEGNDGYRDYTPTVLTPGLQDEKEEWRHKDGGHFYFALPDDVTLSWDVKGSLTVNGYDIKWGMSQTLVPPSVRPEGRYIPTGDILPTPQWLLDRITEHVAEATQRREKRTAIAVNDDVAGWSVATPWDILLSAHDWTDTGKIDKCGCAIWTKPGGGRTSYKSATAHEAECLQYDLLEGHGPLHLWTTEPPEELMSFILAGTQTITKLQYVAAMEYDGDVPAAMSGLVIDGAVDLFGWLDVGADGASADPVSIPSAPGLLTADDNADAQCLSASASTDTWESAESADNADADDSGRQQSYDEVLRAQLQRVMEERGIPAGRADQIKRELAKAELRQVVVETQRRAEAARNSDIVSWLPSPSFVDDFLSGAPEGAEPAVLHRSDGKALLYRGRVNTIVARRAAGKTWAGIAAVADVLDSGGRALYFDMEDTRSEWKSRCHAIGVDIDTAVKEGRAVWIKPEGLPLSDMEVLIDYAGQFDLVVFDVMNRLTIRLGGDPDVANQQVMWLYDNLFDPLAGKDTCVLVLDHPNRKGQKKGAELDDLSPGGGASKMNNASGHVIALIPTTPFTRERAGGDVRMVTLKDRCGHFEEGADVARLVGSLDVGESLFMRLSVKMPTKQQQIDEDEVLLTKAKERILTLLDKHGASTKRDLQSNISEKPRQKFVWALEELIAEGRVVEKEGKYKHADADDC